MNAHTTISPLDTVRSIYRNMTMADQLAIKFDYAHTLTFECGGRDVEVLAEGEYTVAPRDPAQFAIETCTADLSDDVWEDLEEAIAQQAHDDVAQWWADRDDYLDGVAQDRELERRAA